MPTFSNRSQRFVDIGALGCNVPVLGYDAEREQVKLDSVSGTSFAAPQVSFVAGLMKRENSELSPMQIKRRLLFSSDIHYNLQLVSRTGAFLMLRRHFYSIMTSCNYWMADYCLVR